MIQTINADAFSATIVLLFGIPWAGWLLWDLIKHDRLDQ